MNTTPIIKIPYPTPSPSPKPEKPQVLIFAPKLAAYMPLSTSPFSEPELPQYITLSSSPSSDSKPESPQASPGFSAAFPLLLLLMILLIPQHQVASVQPSNHLYQNHARLPARLRLVHPHPCCIPQKSP